MCKPVHEMRIGALPGPDISAALQIAQTPIAYRWGPDQPILFYHPPNTHPAAPRRPPMELSLPPLIHRTVFPADCPTSIDRPIPNPTASPPASTTLFGVVGRGSGEELFDPPPAPCARNLCHTHSACQPPNSPFSPGCLAVNVKGPYLPPGKTRGARGRGST